jgi:RNA polymerase sigma-70 factor (ECF subfamily)
MEGNMGLRVEPAESVLARARGGDAAAFTELVSMHHAELVRVAYLVCGDQELACDAAQAAWVKAWQRLPSLRNPERLRPWLLTIATNEARQVVRSRRRRPVVPIDAVVAEPSVAGPSPDRVDLIAALAHLTPADRSLLALRYVAGIETEAIARATGRSASGTRTRLSRLLARLREEVRDA